MAKTLVEKVTCPKPDVSIFKISGTLGYHENDVLNKFFSECEKKKITKLVMDFSSLTSLGGGCAKIIREAAAEGKVTVFVAGASKMVQSFLENKGATEIHFERSVESALDKLDKPESVGGKTAPGPVEPPDEAPLPQSLDDEAAGAADTPDTPESLADNDLDSPVEDEPTPEALYVDPTDSLTDDSPASPAEPARDSKARGAKIEEKSGGDLRKKILQYRSLFSLNSDFNKIQEKSRLLDAFLLTTIAQVGVESAAFLEYVNDEFIAESWKGFETADPQSLKIATADLDLDSWRSAPNICHLDDAPITKEARSHLENWGMPYMAPVLVYGEFRAIILLGKPIRKELDENSWDYLNILINQFAIAYENSCRFEEESQRTLGLVHSLISMIEENTISRGNTEAIVNYVYSLAIELHYPEEHVRDLVYGTVLRDIGMIKVSDLIVRSPRELLKEEWEIIKRHPIEGAALLQKMKFSEHTIKIVLCHHERFNGEGYPDRLQGNQIPLGARIVSVVESYAAMLQDRPTRPALTREEALNTLKENWGSRYDPDVVVKFIEIVEEEIRTGKTTVYKGSEQFKI